MGRTRVLVRYPFQGADIRLRTSRNWGRDLPPDQLSVNEAVFDLDLGGEDTEWLEFKPVIRTRSGLLWAKGNNYVLYPKQPIRLVYPHFEEPAFNGKLSDLETIDDGEKVHFRVFTPPGYDENILKKYPVLYMFDGANLFIPNEAFQGQEWRVDETLNLLNSLSLVDKVIVVGVYANNRMEDYTDPGYEIYGRFLIQNLKPFIDRRYRTVQGPEHTAVLGSSLGGVLAFYLAWQHPHVFGKAGCMSSTFSFRDNLLERVLSEPKRDLQIYLDSGWPNDNFEVTRRLRDHLLIAGYRFGIDLLYLNFLTARHSEADWSNRFHIPAQFFFGKMTLMD